MKKINLNKLVQEKVINKAKAKKAELTPKAKVMLAKTEKAMNVAFSKVKRKAIRVAPYAALALPGGLALSSYFRAYNKLLDSTMLTMEVMQVRGSANEFADLLIEQLPYLGKSKDEIVAMVGPKGAEKVLENAEQLSNYLYKDSNKGLLDAFHQSTSDQALYEELTNTFGFESGEKLQEACQSNETLAEAVYGYAMDIYQGNTVSLAEGLEHSMDEIVVNPGAINEISVANPYIDQMEELFAKYDISMDPYDIPGQFEVQLGTVMLAATAAVGVGIFAAKKIMDKRKQKSQSATKTKTNSNERTK